MRVLVCGGRDFNSMQYIFNVLDNIHNQNPITSVIHGCATGADTWASRWATIKGIQQERYPAQWEVYGRKAGTLRNVQMIRTNPDLVVAFPGGRGTAHMVKLAQTHNVKVLQY